MKWWTIENKKGHRNQYKSKWVKHEGQYPLAEKKNKEKSI